MINWVECWNCHGSKYLFDGFEIYKCGTCDGVGLTCEHRLEQPCMACIDEIDLEWYHANTKVESGLSLK